MAFFLLSEVRVSGSIPLVIGTEGGAKKPSFLMAFFLFSEVRVSGSTPIIIGAEGGAKKPSEMMAFCLIHHLLKRYESNLVNCINQ
jgi:hypothetical protein